MSKSNKNWTGDKNSIFKTLGASNHTKEDRQEHDFYATEPKAIDILLKEETFNNNIWECACGEGDMSKRLEHHGYKVKSTDLIYRGYGTGNINFLEQTDIWHGDIITNPPYKYAQQFIEHGLTLLETGDKLAMFLKVQFLEGKKRKEMFLKYPPKKIYVSSSRLLCAKNGDFEGMRKGGGSAVAYAWFIWEKGYDGDTIVRWVN